jgi:hypothetical protein
MLCAPCRSQSAPAARRGTALSAGAAWRASRLGVFFCERCGTVLLPSGDPHALVDKLSQLVRFGLIGDSRPILGRAEESD